MSRLTGPGNNIGTVQNLLGLGALILVYIVASAFAVANVKEWAGVGVVALAAAVVGVLFGILFGVPKELEEEEADPEATPEEKALRKRVSVRRNSNLARVSDWLTTLLLGAGLTQLSNIGPAFSDLTSSLATGIASSSSPERVQVVVGAAIVYWLVVGFVAGWLTASVNLVAVFGKSGDAQPAAGGGK